MKYFNGILGIVSLALLMASCVKEKEITLPRDIAVEFPADQQSGTPSTLLFLDGEEIELSAEDIENAVNTYEPDVICLCAHNIIEGVSAGDYLVNNCERWGHSGGMAADGVAVTTSISGAAYDIEEIFVSGDDTEPFIHMNAGGYDFLCGRVLGKNSIYKNGKATILEQTVARDGHARWIVVCRAGWENSTPWGIYQYYWPVYGFSECVFARFGQDSYPSRKDFVFVSEGVLDDISDVELDPLCFTFNTREE